MINTIFMLQIKSKPVVGLAKYVIGTSITNRKRHGMWAMHWTLKVLDNRASQQSVFVVFVVRIVRVVVVSEA